MTSLLTDRPEQAMKPIRARLESWLLGWLIATRNRKFRRGSLLSPRLVMSPPYVVAMLTDCPPAHWPMLMITNSAGNWRATPTSTLTMPCWIEEIGLLLESHST